MNQKQLMLIAHAKSAKTIAEYGKMDAEGRVMVPVEWINALVELADAAIKEYEEC